MGTLRIPLIGLVFCAAALLPLAAISQDGDSWFYGDDFSWVNDVQPAEEQDLWQNFPYVTASAQDGDSWFYGNDFSWVNDIQPEPPAEEQSAPSDPLFNVSGSWNIAEPELPAPEQGWDYGGFEGIEKYDIVPPQELFRSYESLIEPIFDTQGGVEADQGDPALWWSGTESQDQGWLGLYSTDDALWAQQLEFEAAQQRAWEEQQQQEQGWSAFYRTDDTLWTQQLEFEAAQERAWEERQKREHAFIDTTLEWEATAWQRKGMDELTPFEVELLREQEQRDAFNAAAPDPDREARGPLSCVWGSGDCDPFSLKVMRPTTQEARAGKEPQDQNWFDFYRTDDTLQARQREFDAAELQWKGDAEPGVNKNFGWPIDTGRGAEQCVGAGNTAACSKAYVDWTVAQTRFGNTASPENVAPQQPSTFRLPAKVAEESAVDRLKKDPVFGFFLNTIPDAYDATKERVTGWYDSMTNSVPPAASGGTFAERFRSEASVWNNDPAAQEALLKEWASRTDVDTRFSTREALPPLEAPTDVGSGTPLPRVEQPLLDGALPFGMSMSDGRLEVNRNADAQSTREFEEYKKYNLINEANRYADTKFPVIVDFGDKAVVLRGEEYGLQGSGVGVVRGNNLGNFNFGWDTTVAQKAEGTFASGFEGYKEEGAAAKIFLGNVNPETKQTIAQDVAKEIGKYESEKGFFGRVADSISLSPSTVSVEVFHQSRDKFFVQDIVGPYDKNNPPEKKEDIKFIPVDIVIEQPKAPESAVVPQEVAEEPAAPPAEPATVSAPAADTSELSSTAAPLPEPVDVGRRDVKEVAPPLPAATPGNDTFPCVLCSKDAETPSPLPMPELVPPEEAPQGDTTAREEKILSDLKEPATDTSATPAEQDLLDKLKTSGNAAPSAADRREISEVIKGKPKSDIEVNFALGSAAIDDRAKTGLDQLGNILVREEFNGKTILINGYTDGYGGPDYNLGLSQRRAEAIRQYLIKEFRFEPDRLIAVGFGKEQLKFPNSPYAPGNRRVQIVIAQ